MKSERVIQNPNFISFGPILSLSESLSVFYWYSWYFSKPPFKRPERDRSSGCSPLFGDTIDAIQSLMALNYPISHHFTISFSLFQLQCNWSSVTELVVSWGAYSKRISLCKSSRGLRSLVLTNFSQLLILPKRTTRHFKVHFVTLNLAPKIWHNATHWKPSLEWL